MKTKISKIKVFNKLLFLLFVISMTFNISCGDDKKSNATVEKNSENETVQNIESKVKSENHTYDISINPGAANARHLKGEIENTSKTGFMDNNYSNYSNADNGKGIVLRIANDDIIISGMFFYDNNGNTAHLSDGSEDHDEVSHIILTINPPSTDAQNSLSGTVNLSNVKFAFQNPEGGAVGYTLVFDGSFEDYDENISQIKGKVEVRVPNY